MCAHALKHIIQVDTPACTHVLVCAHRHGISGWWCGGAGELAERAMGLAVGVTTDAV